MSDHITISLSDNDNQGNFAGQVFAVSLGHALFATNLNGIAIARHEESGYPRGIIVGATFCRLQRYVEWYGSMAYSGYVLTMLDAANLLTALFARPGWCLEYGDSHLAPCVRGTARVTDEKLRRSTLLA